MRLGLPHLGHPPSYNRDVDKVAQRRGAKAVKHEKQEMQSEGPGPTKRSEEAPGCGSLWQGALERVTGLANGHTAVMHKRAAQKNGECDI